MDSRTEIEDIVTNAMGNSVTPSRLQDPKKPGMVRRLLGNNAVEGPFIEDIESDEQPHYLFHTTNRVEVPENVAEDEAIFSIFSRSLFSPATLLVTDTQVLLVYKSGANRVVRKYDYTAIDDVECQQTLNLEQSLDIILDGNRISFEMWNSEQFTEELSDAAAYISDKSNAVYTNIGPEFGDGKFEDAVNTLQAQLHNLSATTQNLDTSLVIRYAKKGAKIGVTRGARTAAVGFLLGAGYGIWTDIQRETDGEPPTFDPDQIDAQTTATEIVRWEQVGNQVANQKGRLAGAAIGAAVAIDQQTTDRASTQILSELDTDAVAHQLEDGQFKDGGLEIAEQTLDSYSDGLGTLLADDFFDQVR